jgi:DNA polymerase I-like protein with 3'-5' exonuclease and polymerase domains
MDNCELTTEMGRKRRWSLITADNSWKVENQACNFKGQSMASDLCLTSLIQLQKELTARGWGRVLLTVHDSIVFSLLPGSIHEAVELIQKIMTTPTFPTKTPFKVDVTCGPNYGDQEDYDPEGVYV